MFDGKLDITDPTEATQETLRKIYEDKSVKGLFVPAGMKIQGVDVINPSDSLISYQQGLYPEIKALQDQDITACIVIFEPIRKPRGLTSNFHAYSDPNMYVVVSSTQANMLLGNDEANQPLRNNMTRRLKRVERSLG